MIAKTTIRTLYFHVVLNDVIFPQILYDIVPDRFDTFYLSSVFPSVTLTCKLCIQLPQNVTWTDE